MSHYFENDETLAHNLKALTFTLSGTTLHLLSDKGIFSNKEIDDGSIVLLKTLVKTETALHGNVLDVGAGYGTLGLYIAKHYPDTTVTLFDVNERAIAVTNMNIAANNITNAHAYVASNYQALHNHYFDLIVINPPIRAGKKVYYPLLSAAKDYLTDGGKLLCVIRKSHGAKSAETYMQTHYKDVELIGRDKGFYVYRAMK
jgi:16S rRNA (guanine1207-N2)-methyltransferase